MTSVSHLAQHLLQLGPQQSTPRLALYHYMKNLASLDQVLTPDHIKKFYNLALTFEHWREHRVELGKSIQKDLKSFLDLTGRDEFQMRHSDELQLVSLENPQDAEDLIRRHSQDKLGPDFKLQIRSIEDRKVLLLALAPNGELLVQTFPQWALIRAGILEPLGPLSRLVYAANMDFLPGAEQQLELKGPKFARFREHQKEIAGLVVQNHAFQKEKSLNGPLTLAREVFFAVKKIERHFVNLNTDPFYSEIISALDLAIQKLKADLPEAVTLAHRALDRGQTALHQIFVDDKLLLVLVSNLENQLLMRKKRYAEKLTPQVEVCQKIQI